MPSRGRGRGQDEECIQKRKTNTRRMSGGAPPSPNQVLKNQRDTPGRVTNWTGPPHHKKLRGQRKNSGERKDPALQNKNLNDREPSLKGRNGQTPTRRQGDIHAKRKEHCQEQRPYRNARNQKPRPHPRERREAENLRHPERTPAAHTGKSDSRRAASKTPMRGRPTHENAQVKKIIARPLK